jgi:hypothetical protein
MPESIRPSETQWQIRLDKAIDQISFLKDKVNRLRVVLDDLLATVDVNQFELLQLALILEETREDSDLRRFPVAEDEVPVLASTSSETKEDTQ